MSAAALPVGVHDITDSLSIRNTVVLGNSQAVCHIILMSDKKNKNNLLETGVWKEEFSVRSYEVEPTGFASPQTICNYLQEVAANHAHALQLSIEHLTEKRLIWVLSRLRVHIKKYPRWREVVCVETWPSGENGLFATREFMVYDEHNEELARATSAWILVDVERRRPVRMPSFVSELRVPHREFPLPGKLEKLTPPSRNDFERRFSVRYSDLDVNQHTNNVRYIDWAIETIPRVTVEGYRLSDLDIVFKAETVYGHSILAYAERIEKNTDVIFKHRLSRDEDARDVATLETRWIKDASYSSPAS